VLVFRIPKVTEHDDSTFHRRYIVSRGSRPKPSHAVIFYQYSPRALEVRLEEVPATPTAHTQYIRRAANVVRDRYFLSGTPPIGGRRDGRNSRRVDLRS